MLFMLLGGLAGGALRYGTEKSLQTRSRRPTHWGPFTLNLLGCCLFGALAGWAYQGGLSAGTTLLGGVITAFSVCGYETARLFRAGRHGSALLSAMVGWFIGLIAAAMGVLISMR
jgi:CrcB protein